MTVYSFIYIIILFTLHHTQLLSDSLRIVKDKCAPWLDLALHNPPKPHAFTSLSLQSDYLWHQFGMLKNAARVLKKT